MKKIFIFFIIVCLFVPLEYMQGQETEYLLDDFSPEDTYYLGRAVAAGILSFYKQYEQNQRAIQYVNRICQTLVINSGHPNTYGGYFVMILDSNEINAFATPAGHIFITKKLIESVDSEDMIAAVIAHELAHIMLQHGIKMIKDARVEDELIDIANWAAGVAAQYSKEAVKSANFRSSVSGMIDVLMKNGYSIVQEYEADMEAIVLLSKAGYDPKAYLEMLKILQKVQGRQNSGLYSTHPSPEQRQKNMEALRFSANNTRQYRTKRFGENKL